MPVNDEDSLHCRPELPVLFSYLKGKPITARAEAYNRHFHIKARQTPAFIPYPFFKPMVRTIDFSLYEIRPAH